MRVVYTSAAKEWDVVPVSIQGLLDEIVLYSVTSYLVPQDI